MDLWHWVVAGVAAFMFGLSKGGITGLSILPVAIFASIMPARASVGVVLLVLISGDIVAVLSYRRNADWHQLVRLFPWAVLGIVIGTLTLNRIDDSTVRVLIGAIVILLVLFRVVRFRKALAEVETTPHPWVAALAGIGAGFTTMVANAAGPIMVLYLLAMRLPMLEFIGTTAWFFLAINLLKVPFSYHLGLINLSSVWLSARLWPPAIAGTLSGRWLVRRIDQQLFERISLVLALIAGVRLLMG